MFYALLAIVDNERDSRMSFWMSQSWISLPVHSRMMKDLPEVYIAKLRSIQMFSWPTNLCFLDRTRYDLAAMLWRSRDFMSRVDQILAIFLDAVGSGGRHCVVSSSFVNILAKMAVVICYWASSVWCLLLLTTSILACSLAAARVRFIHGC